MLGHVPPNSHLFCEARLSVAGKRFYGVRYERCGGETSSELRFNRGLLIEKSSTLNND